MKTVFFPSCNFTKASPDAARKLFAYMESRAETAACCRVDALEYGKGVKALYFCQACRETIETRAPGKFALENLFVYMAGDKEFPWPDYGGLTVTVQDCRRDREHPEIFAAVRRVLSLMNINVIEMAENMEKSVFCGNLYFKPKKPENMLLLAKYGDKPLYTLPDDMQAQLMREQVEKMPCPLAVTYCNRCKAGITAGGGRAVHLMELAMGTFGD